MNLTILSQDIICLNSKMKNYKPTTVPSVNEILKLASSYFYCHDKNQETAEKRPFFNPKGLEWWPSCWASQTTPKSGMTLENPIRNTEVIIV